MLKSKIAPSIMCADLVALKQQLESMRQLGIEYLHVDVMDGVFVPNYMLGTDFCKTLKKMSPIPLDIHLMITQPEQKISWFPISEGDYVSVHYEAGYHVMRSLQTISQMGGKPMVALNPGTPINEVESLLPLIDGVLLMTVNPGFAGQQLVPGALLKIAAMRRFLDERGYADIDIEVDGNVSFDNAVKMREAGANIFVAGTSSIFSGKASLETLVERLRTACR